MKNQEKIRMIKTISLAAFGLLFVGCLTTSCSKKKQGCTNPLALNYDKDAEDESGSCVLAGKPGNVNLMAFPQHHGVPIVSSKAYHDSIYIKYNSLEFPGDNPTLYDLAVQGENQKDFVRITGLSQGNYYIFMTGFDPSIGERVTGGIPYTMVQPKGELDLVVPVTE